MPIVENPFETQALIPEILPSHPKRPLEVRYPDLRIEPGCFATPTQVREPPAVVDWDAENDQLYTVMMIDPDAPQRERPTNRDWLHWLVINVPGDHISQGQTIAEYIGSAPPKGSGKHRYILAVFQQPGKIQPTDVKHLSKHQAKGRAKFATIPFLERNKLAGPLAATFFQAEWDNAVPAIYQQLTE